MGRCLDRPGEERLETYSMGFMCLSKVIHVVVGVAYAKMCFLPSLLTKTMMKVVEKKAFLFGFFVL